MSKFAERCKAYYESGWYTRKMLKNMVEKGKLTEEEYNEITGESYG
jgi:uncharacterized XkdX family phage protein